MMRGMRLAVGLMLGTGSFAIGAGYDGNAEHLKQTRRPIPILKGIGTADFRITCQNAQTQQYFNQGIALLHGDELREADRSFYQACRIEPSHPMTWWGLAAANLENRPLAAFYVDRAVQLQEAASDREKMWISALNSYLDSGTSEIDRRTFMVTSLDRIIAQYPDDLEACAFLARQFVQNREAGLPIPLMSAADLMIEHVLRHNPAHPVRHYKLLLWERIQPERALPSAEHARRELPSAARIQTAAGRVYSRRERHDDALSCLEASTLVACLRMKRDRLCPVEVAGFVENIALQIDELALVGRANEAVAMCRQLIEMPTPAASVRVTAGRIPAGHELGAGRAGGRAPNAAILGQQKLLDILVDYRRWEELLTLDRGKYFASTDREIQWRRLHAVGLAQFSRRDATAIAAQIDGLQRLPTNPVTPDHGTSRSTPIDGAIRRLRSCEAIARNQPPAETTDPSLAEMFPETADRATAEQLALPTADRVRSAAKGLNRVRMLRSLGRSDAAVAALDELKMQFPRMDADLPRRLGLVSGDEIPLRSDTESAARSMQHWQPPLAPPFKLSDRHGQSLSLDDLRGRRVVLVFYLGAGCPHCIEQLQTFAPLKERFEQAGLTVVAVSTDSVAGLQKTFQVAGAGDAIPFQLVSDETMSAFREFGAFDTRDNEPLHGTFLIDARGRIVWQNIRREPFMATNELLLESQRVFSLSRTDDVNVVEQ